MKKIIEIILNENYQIIDKVILIYREEMKGKGEEELAAVLNIPFEVLKSWNPGPAQDVEVKKNGKPIIHEYIELFLRMYEKLKGVKYTLSDKEAGQLKIIMKKIKSIQEWTKILKVVYYECLKYEKGEKQKFTWKTICEDVRPSIISSKLNFIVSATKDYKKEKDWEGYDKRNKYKP